MYEAKGSAGHDPFDERLELRRLPDRQIGEHLPVQLDIGLLESIHILASVGGFTFGYKPTAVVKTFSLNATTTTIEYNVEISESKVDPLIIQIHNQFMKEQKEITIGVNEGEFNNLKPGMQYKISILEKGVLVKSQNLFTQYA